MLDTNQKTNICLEKISNNFKDGLRDFLELCESPIEKLFLVKFLKRQDSFMITNRSKPFFFEKKFDTELIHIDFYQNSLFLIPQIETNNNIRIDFVLFLPDIFHIAIECDGHEFHEKTKEQAKRDKQRDRHLVESGFYVFHYTGSEIFNDDKIYLNLDSFMIDKLIEKFNKEKEKINR